MIKRIDLGIVFVSTLASFVHGCTTADETYCDRSVRCEKQFYCDVEAYTCAPFAAELSASAATAAISDWLLGVQPASGSIDIDIDQQIVIAFPVSVDEATINELSIRLDGPLNEIQVSRVVQGPGVTVKSKEPLSSGTDYTVTIWGQFIKDALGELLTKDTSNSLITTSFRTRTAPQIVSTTPSVGETNVATNSVIEIVFDRLLNCSLIDEQHFSYVRCLKRSRSMSDSAVRIGGRRIGKEGHLFDWTLLPH